MTSTRHLGLDLGGTLLKWAVVESTDGGWDRLATDLVPTRVDAGAEGIVDQLAETASAAAADWGPIASVGVGIPGRYDAAGGRVIMTPNIPVRWEGTRVVERLEPVVHVPVHLLNDARAFTLAELRLGAGRGAQTLVGMTLGTGVGGGIAIRGTLYLGRDGAAGEIGHQTIDPDGPLCNCGNRGCVEAFARADVIAATCGASSVEAAVRAAADGDARATRRARAGRAIPGDRHREHRDRPDAGSRGGGRRRGGGGRGPLRADPRGARPASPDDRHGHRRARARRARDLGRGDRRGDPRRRPRSPSRIGHDRHAAHRSGAPPADWLRVCGWLRVRRRQARARS